MMITLGDKSPLVHETAFIAPGTKLIGDVTIGEESSIWYNCVLRGDVNAIRIGKRSNIQDGSILHVDSPKPSRPEGLPLLIGDDVLIGHLAMVHGSILHDRAFVGLGATVMDECIIETDGMLAAGALLTPGKRIPAGQVWAGRPAKYLRDLTETEIAGHQAGVAAYVRNAKIHAAAVRAMRG